MHLPDTPFLVGDLDPRAVLAELVDGPVLVDNDVNWAALAERSRRPATAMDDFVYLYLGEGLGCAVVSDGEVRRGHSGLSGEIAHLITTGARGRAMPFTEVFARTRGTPRRVNGDRRRRADRGRSYAAGAAGRKALDAIAVAVCGVLSAAVALTDPRSSSSVAAGVTHPAVIGAVSAAFARAPRHVPRAPGGLTEERPSPVCASEQSTISATITGYRRASAP